MVLRYPGSKAKYLNLLSPYLDWLVDGETVFVDVCVGAGSVLLHVARTYPHLRLVVNDLDSLIADFWRAVADKEMVRDLCEKLKTPVTHALRQDLLANEPQDTVGRAHAAVVLTRTSYSGILKAGMFGGGRDGSPVKDLKARYNPDWVVREVMKYHEVLAGRVEVSQVHAIECVRMHRDAPLFVDPPYYHRGRGLYRHVPDSDEHEGLAHEIRCCRRALLTYDDCPEVEALYGRYQIDRFPATYQAGRNPNNAWKETNEIVIAV